MSDKRSTLGVVAIAIAVVAAVYELVAYVTDWIPTITEIIEDLPELLEAGLLLVAVVWAADHFGWINLRSHDRQ